jgi:hypothetical protein
MPIDLGNDIKTFLLYLLGDIKTNIKPIATSIIIKTKNRRTKFKLRTPSYLYTLKVDDEKKANKIKSSIPSNITKIEINEKKTREKKVKSNIKFFK